MCSFEDVCLAYSDGDCPIIRNNAEDDCPGHFNDYKLSCKLCDYSQYCKLECEDETIQD